MIQFWDSDSVERRSHSCKGRSQESPEILLRKKSEEVIDLGWGGLGVSGRISKAFHVHILSK